MKKSNGKFVSSLLLLVLILNSCQIKQSYYSANDFEKVPKIDGHFHYLTYNEKYIEYASALNFKVLSPTWDGEYSFEEQLKIAKAIWNEHSDNFAFLGTFSVADFGTENYAERTITQIEKCLREGAAGIKIWKNIGMVLQDSSGRYVMIDDPAFAPVFLYLEENNIPVVAHLGEPKDCWLPFEEMTDPSDVSYYKNNPQYYMYLHPEVPSYDEQIAARDHILELYPNLVFVGAHLGSLEWSVDELAKRFDSYPNFKVDLAARMYHLQYQSALNLEKVRDFMIKYQDKIIYGTDNEVHDLPETDPALVMSNLKKGWMAHWIYLATDSVQSVQGLHLPEDVIDKIYYKNAQSFLGFKK